MKKLQLLVVASGLMILPVAQAQSTGGQELPSAPSATLQEQMQKQRPPAPPPQEQQTAPVSASPAQSAAAAKPSANTAGDPLPASNAPAGAAAKGDGPDTGDTPYVFKTGVNEVSLVFTVTDKHGRFVKDLKKEDFKILDDNKPPKDIAAFRAETDLPLRVGLLVDASNSIRDRFTFEQESAIEFLNQIIRPKSDKAFVLGFDTTAEIMQDFTDNTELLSRGVRSLRAGGGTAMYDALFYACRDKLLKTDQHGGNVRRAIILLSDGEDNQSRVTREEAIEMAQRAEVIVYAISTNVSGVKTRGDKVLERLAETTGGRAFFPFKVQDVANAFSEIQDELRSQYLLAYKPADFQADGRFHAIDIQALTKKNLKVRTRKGYFAPKQ